MNKQNIAKLQLFFTGIEARYEENQDFFECIRIEFYSGTKKFNAIAEPENDSLKYNYKGETKSLDINNLFSLVTKEATEFDKLRLEYYERGNCLIIEADEKNVTMKSKEYQKKEAVEENHFNAATITKRDYYIKPSEASGLLSEIGIMGTNGKIKNDMIRKYNQIDYFVELVSEILVRLSESKKCLNIIDCGCGKSYLSFVLNFYIKEVLKKNCCFLGLDISEDVIKSAKEIAGRLNYRNMDFINADAREFIGGTKTLQVKKPHMIISLHACDIATDYAIAMGIKNEAASIIAVPCCHRELLSQYSYEPFKNILKYGMLKARMADTLTDGLRGLLLEAFGYTVSIIEYISPLESPKNLMIKAEKTTTFNRAKYEEYIGLRKSLNVNLTLEKMLFDYIAEQYVN